MKYTRQQRYDIYHQVHEKFLRNEETFICHAISKALTGHLNGIDIDDFPELKFVAPRKFILDNNRIEWKCLAFCVDNEEPAFEVDNEEPAFEHISKSEKEEYKLVFEDVDNFIVKGNNYKLWKATMLEFMMELCVQDDLDQWNP